MAFFGVRNESLSMQTNTIFFMGYVAMAKLPQSILKREARSSQYIKSESEIVADQFKKTLDLAMLYLTGSNDKNLIATMAKHRLTGEPWSP